VGASPTRQPLQPEATGAVMEATKWLKPSDIGSGTRPIGEPQGSPRTPPDLGEQSGRAGRACGPAIRHQPVAHPLVGFARQGAGASGVVFPGPFPDDGLVSARLSRVSRGAPPRRRLRAAGVDKRPSVHVSETTAAFRETPGNLFAGGLAAFGIRKSRFQ